MLFIEDLQSAFIASLGYVCQYLTYLAMCTSYSLKELDALLSLTVLQMRQSQMVSISLSLRGVFILPAF